MLLDELGNVFTLLLDGLLGGCPAIHVGESAITAVLKQRVDGLQALVLDGHHEGSIALLIWLVDVGPVHKQQLHDGELVLHGAVLQSSQPVLLVYRGIDVESGVLQNLGQLFDVLTGDGPQRHELQRVGEPGPEPGVPGYRSDVPGNIVHQ